MKHVYTILIGQDLNDDGNGPAYHLWEGEKSDRIVGMFYNLRDAFIYIAGAVGNQEVAVETKPRPR